MVAIKIIDKTKLDGKMTKMVLREITVMDACSHPHLVRLYEVVENSQKMHLVMQLAPGRELFTKLSEQGENNKLFTKLCDQGELHHTLHNTAPCTDARTLVRGAFLKM